MGGGGGEEEERLPWSHGRWALASSPGGPTQTSQGSPPSYLRWSKTNLAAHLRTLFPAGRLGLSASVRQRYGPICLPVLATDRSELSWTHPSQRPRINVTEGVGPPGHHPRLKNVAGLNRTRPSTPMRTAGGLSTAGGASTVTLHDHAHRRWPGYLRVLWVRDLCQRLVGPRLSGRCHGGALPWRSRRGDALVSWRHHSGAPPLLSRHIGARLFGRCVCGALP